MQEKKEPGQQVHRISVPTAPGSHATDDEKSPALGEDFPEKEHPNVP